MLTFVTKKLAKNGAEGTRTPDSLRAKEMLSQLSYSPITKAIIPATPAGGNLRGIPHCVERGDETISHIAGIDCFQVKTP
jgi:hypothetical protein